MLSRSAEQKNVHRSCFMCAAAIKKEIHNNNGGNIVLNEITAYFVVAKILELSHSNCVDLLRSGENPLDWVDFCQKCFKRVGDAEKVFKQFIKLEAKWNKLKDEYSSQINKNARKRKVFGDADQRGKVLHIISQNNDISDEVSVASWSNEKFINEELGEEIKLEFDYEDATTPYYADLSDEKQQSAAEDEPSSFAPKRTKRGAIFTPEETKTMLEIWSLDKFQIKFRKTKKHTSVWKQIAHELFNAGNRNGQQKFPARGPHELQNKYKNVRRLYSELKSGNASIENEGFPYYAIFETVLANSKNLPLDETSIQNDETDNVGTVEDIPIPRNSTLLKRCRNFTQEETIVMLKIYGSEDIQKLFRIKMKSHKLIWNLIADKLFEIGKKNDTVMQFPRRNGAEVQNRHKNMKKLYNSIKIGNSGISSNDFPYYDTFERHLGALHEASEKVDSSKDFRPLRRRTRNEIIHHSDSDYSPQSEDSEDGTDFPVISQGSNKRKSPLNYTEREDPYSTRYSTDCFEDNIYCSDSVSPLDNEESERLQVRIVNENDEDPLASKAKDYIDIAPSTIESSQQSRKRSKKTEKSRNKCKGDESTCNLLHKRPKWTPNFTIHETKIMLSIWSSDVFQTQFRITKKHRLIWDQIAMELYEAGKREDGRPRFPRRRYFELHNRYKNMKKVYTSLKTGSLSGNKEEFPYLAIFEKVLESSSLPQTLSKYLDNSLPEGKHLSTGGESKSGACNSNSPRRVSPDLSLTEIAWKCKRCKKEFASLKALDDHIFTIHTLTLKCRLCDDLTFSKSVDLIQHVKDIHSEMERPFICKCGKEFSLLRNLQQHERTQVHHKNLRFQCQQCGKRFEKRKDLETHEAVVHRRERNFICEDCGDSFTSFQYLKYHKISKHNAIEIVESSPNLTTKCEQCGRVLSDPASLRNHIKAIHEKNQKFNCPICNSGSRSKYGIDRHILSAHTNIKPEVCPICEKSFAQKSTLKTHMQIHTGEKVDCQECGKSFNCRIKLKRHIMAVHTADKNKRFSCELCQKTFSSNRNLRSHLKHAHKIQNVVRGKVIVDEKTLFEIVTHNEYPNTKNALKDNIIDEIGNSLQPAL